MKIRLTSMGFWAINIKIQCPFWMQINVILLTGKCKRDILMDLSAFYFSRLKYLYPTPFPFLKLLGKSNIKIHTNEFLLCYVSIDNERIRHDLSRREQIRLCWIYRESSRDALSLSLPPKWVGAK